MKQYKETKKENITTACSNMVKKEYLQVNVKKEY